MNRVFLFQFLQLSQFRKSYFTLGCLLYFCQQLNNTIKNTQEYDIKKS